MTENDIKKALSFVIEPDLKKDVVALDLVSDILIEGNEVSFTLQVNNPALHNKKRITEACNLHAKRVLGEEVTLSINIVPLPKNTERPAEQRKILPNVKNIVAISSGKGGVGKSTVTANLAAGLAKKGYKVGLIDADIYGPSMPLMFDVLQEKPKPIKVDGHELIEPIESYGVKMLSIGFFAAIDEAVVWRGPMATKALMQMFTDTYWGELDYMLIDLPPGTGDIHLTLVQNIPLTGAIVVTTPQAVALADAKKGISMFQLPNVKIPVLGLIENMSYFSPAELPDNKYYIFGESGGKRLAEDMGVQLLGELPLVQGVREAADVGRPAVLQESDKNRKAIDELIVNFEAKIAEVSLVPENA